MNIISSFPTSLDSTCQLLVATYLIIPAVVQSTITPPHPSLYLMHCIPLSCSLFTPQHAHTPPPPPAIHPQCLPLSPSVMQLLTLTLRISLRASSCMTGPRNWQPLFLTAVQRSVEICCWFWCITSSSVTVLSAMERAALRARTLLSPSST